MSDMKEVICTCCPQGCHLQVDEANDYKVTGNGCPNGITYGKEELTQPTCTPAARSRPPSPCPRDRWLRLSLRWTAWFCTPPSMWVMWC